MRKRRLEMILSSLQDIDDPRADLEQYPTPVDLVSDILFDAAASGDVEGKRVAELGCGNGPFSIGAYLLGAASVTGYDIDPRCVEVSGENFARILESKDRADNNADISFEIADIGDVHFEPEKVDTVFMNPPFGAQRKGADRPFIDTALKMARSIYSIHNANTLKFLRKEITENRGTILSERIYMMTLDYRYPFHTREKKDIRVAVLRISGRMTDE